MTGRRPSRRNLVVAIGSLVAAALATTTNLFTNTLPDIWPGADNTMLMGIVTAFLVLLAMMFAVVLSRMDHPDGSSGVLTRLVRPYGRRYRQWVIRDQSRVDVAGLITIGSSAPGLNDILVRVEVIRQAPGRVGSGLLEQISGSMDTHSIWRYLHRSERSVLVVLGAPGSGKTTLLSHIACATAKNTWGASRSTPVVLRIPEHAEAIEADPGMTLPALARSAVPDLGIDEPSGWWEQRFRRGRCIVLLDGLDEVPDPERRRTVVQRIDRWTAVHPRTSFVVTSRAHGYRDSYIREATSVQVLPFNAEQRRDFLHKWYRHAERSDADGTDIAAADARGAQRADALLGQLGTVRALQIGRASCRERV